MDFSEALAVCKAGGKITRTGWNGPGQYVVHQKGYPAEIAMRQFAPYLMMCNAQGVFVPWLASQGDLLAEDWVQVS